MRHLSVLAAVLLAAAPAAAQEAEIHLRVEADGNQTSFVLASDENRSGNRINVPRDRRITVEVQCEEELCEELSAAYITTEGVEAIEVQDGDTEEEKHIIVPEQAFREDVARLLLMVRNKIHELHVTRAAPRIAANDFFRNTSCEQRLTLQGPFYSARQNLAQFVVTPQGTVLARPEHPIDENDQVLVYVVGTQTELENIRVKRSSDAREGGELRIQGFDALDEKDRNENGEGGADPVAGEPCTVVRADLGDFESGRGRISITRLNDEGQPGRDLGEIDVTVNPVYSGAFSLGPVLTWNDDRTYDTLADRTITETSRGPETHYVLAYTHFLGGHRDTEKSGPIGLGATIAVDPKEVFDHAFAGVALDIYGAVFLLGGAHGAQVKRINSESGLTVGSTLPAQFASVPTQDEWRWGGFAGITIDLRAAAGLLRQAASTLLGGTGR